MGKNSLFAMWLLVCLALVCTEASLRGIAPADAAKYEAQDGHFVCFSGQRIPHARLNDDYCDCEDGSDEPGTAACNNGRFHCRNKGHLPKILPSAHVDDGICDCCDGSDESTVSCPNTCREMGEKTRQLHREKIAETKQALKTRSEYEATAAAEIPTKRLRIEELEKQMKEEDAILEAVNLKKQALEKDWREANDEKELREKRIQEEQEKAEQQDTGFDDEAEQSDEHKTAEEAATTAAATEEQASTEEPKPTEEPAPPGPYASWSDKDVFDKAEELRLLFDEGSKAHMDQVSVKDKIKKELDDLNQILKHDLKAETGLYSLFKQCFEKQITEYKYKHCFLDQVDQSSTLLGKFNRFERDEAGILRLYYTGGARCWGADARSVVVEVECANVNEIVTVTEPNKCAYVMAFKSPMGCTEETLRQLEEQLRLEESALEKEEL